MDSTAVSFQTDNEQFLNNDLWQLALQNSFPLPPSAFSTSFLPQGFLSNYHQCLATYHQSVNPHLNENYLWQYPATTANGEAQPYPDIDQFDFLKVEEDSSGLLPFDHPQLSDVSLSGSQTLLDTSSETSSPAELDGYTSSPSPERSLSPELETRRRKRKSSTTSEKSRSSSSSKSGQSNISRVRERNRISAQRFRDKKKADAIDLELKTLKLSEQRDLLVREITDLQWQSIVLQEQCLQQVMCGCDDMKKFFKNKTHQNEKLCHTELHAHS